MTHDELKKWRLENHYSQSQLANELGTHVMTISQWERNIRTIPPFLHLALRCLEMEGGESKKKAQRKKEKKMKGSIQKKAKSIIVIPIAGKKNVSW